eukprot:3279398-Pyramimonas_sp.AAC.1
MDPHFNQALRATSPFASPRAAGPQNWRLPIWRPMDADQHGNMQLMKETAHSAGSMLSQQQWMHRQMWDAMEQMRRDG